jgi:molybdopterin/thiamine biosynthesis adenylyltransferase
MKMFEPYITSTAPTASPRYLANDAAHFSQPLVHGSIFRFQGRLALFDSSHGTGCYRCLFPGTPPPGSAELRRSRRFRRAARDHRRHDGLRDDQYLLHIGSDDRPVPAVRGPGHVVP